MMGLQGSQTGGGGGSLYQVDAKSETKDSGWYRLTCCEGKKVWDSRFYVLGQLYLTENVKENVDSFQ